MIKKVDHIAFAVKDLKKTITHAEKLGGKHLFTVQIEKRGYEVAAMQFGEAVLTFLRPIREDSAVQDYLNERGEGLHHIGLEVENLDEYINKLESEGINIPVKRLGGSDRREILADEKDGFGYVLQLIEWKGGPDIPAEERMARFSNFPRSQLS